MKEAIEIVGLIAMASIFVGLASIMPMIIIAAYRDLIKKGKK